MNKSIAIAAGLPGLAALLIAFAVGPRPPAVDLNPGAGVPLEEGQARWGGTIAVERGAGDAVALQFLAGYTTGEWSGRLVKTGPDPSQPPLWEAGSLLEARDPATRSLWTLNAATSAVHPFASASFAQFDPELQAVFDASPANGLADGKGPARVEYLRGDRTPERAGTMRERKRLLGDILHAGPVYQAGPEPVVYAGANDGFLHAFRASDGHELWAYLPRAAAANAPSLADAAYRHRAFADGMPSLGKAHLEGEWKTVLAAGLGAGAPGLFALDVTHPQAFGPGGGRREATVLFEFTSTDDASVGEILAPPLVARVRVSVPPARPAWRWFAVTGSGYNNYAGPRAPSNDQAVFFLALDKPRADPWREGDNYFKVALPAHRESEANGAGALAAVPGEAGELALLYVGDLQGRLWRLDLSRGLTKENAASGAITGTDERGRPSPFFVASGPGGAQPITAAAAVGPAPARGHMVVFGTGRFLAQGDEADRRKQRIYAVWDRLSPAREKPIEAASLARAGGGANGVAFVPGEARGEHPGCYIELEERGERVVRDAAAGLASVAIASFVPDEAAARLYLVDAATCGVAASALHKTTAGPPSPFLPVPRSGAGASYAPPDATGRRRLAVTETAHLPLAGLPAAPSVQAATRTFEAGRVSWRELRGLKGSP